MIGAVRRFVSGVFSCVTVLLARPFASDPALVSLGRRGEDSAARYLKRRGYRIIARNATSTIGEIDLLAESPGRDTVVVVEVKSRTIRQDGGNDRLPERAITAAKGRKLASLARSVARTQGLEGRRIRIDVVAVDFEAGVREPSEIRHYPNAINASGRRV